MGVAFGGGALISGCRIWSGAALIWDPGLYGGGCGGAGDVQCGWWEPGSVA